MRSWLATLTVITGLAMSTSTAQAIGPVPPPEGKFGLTAGPDGNLWVADALGNQIVRVTPSGTMTRFPLSTFVDVPSRIVAGPDGNLWFTFRNTPAGSSPYTRGMGRITPAGVVTLFALPALFPLELTAGSDGNVWFTSGIVGRITPDGIVTTFPGTEDAGVITNGPDGNVWFKGSGRIGRITPAGVLTSFAASVSPFGGITGGPDGNLWFTEPSGNSIGRITPAGVITQFTRPNATLCLGAPAPSLAKITSGPDGNLWYAATCGVGRITPAGVITEFPLANTSSVSEVTSGPDGNVWFMEDYNAADFKPRIVRMTLAGIATRFGLPLGNFVAAGAGPGGGPNVVLEGVPFTQSCCPIREVAKRLGDFFPYPPAFPGGVRVAVGDVNGTGAPALITGPGPGGGPHVRVLDAATGTELFGFFAYDPGFTGGIYVAAGDVTGDGRADIVTAPGPGGGPHVRVFDGATAQGIASFFAYDPGFRGGVFVAAGDVRGIGRADIVTGAGSGGGPHVRVFDGMTGQPVAGFFAYAPGFTGGVRVAAGDVRGIGRADIITAPGPGGGPHVRVFDGVTGTEVRGFLALDPGFSGGLFVAAADLGCDGKAEIIVGTGPGGGTAIRVFDGARGAPWPDTITAFLGFPGEVVVAGHGCGRP